MFRDLDDREVSLCLDYHLKPQYKYAYTSEVLPLEATKDAMLDELQYFCSVVFRGVSLEEALNDQGGKVVGCR